MPDTTKTEKKRRRRLWLIALVLFVVALIFSIWWMGPAPPREIVMATGEEAGIYSVLGEEYQKRLDKLGLSVSLRHSQGSVDNLQLLLDRKVDVALIQAGTYEYVKHLDEKEELRGLIAIQWEPVWVFYRNKEIENISDFKAWAKKRKKKLKIAIGQENSGTAAVAKDILQANGLEKEYVKPLELSMEETRDHLLQGKIDIGFLVSNAHNSIIQELLHAPDIRLFSFTRNLAYTRRFPYLTTVILGEGVINLEENIPDREVKMFATPTLLVCRKDLHPHAVEQILIVAKRIHSKPELVSATQTFPTLEGLDLKTHETAEAYMHSGESLMTRMLPYWGVWLLFKVQILILPLLVLWLPFLRMFPLVYTFRINWLLRQHYAALRDIEDQIEKAEEPSEIHEQINLLDNLRKNMETFSRKIPTHLQINVYQWRLHVSHVRAEALERLWHLETEQKKQDEPLTETAPLQKEG